MNEPIGRVQPHSEDSEKYVLACCFMDGAETLSKALDAKVCAETFYVERNGLIWRSLCWLQKKGLVIDMGVLAEELKKQGKLDAVGGYPYLLEISQKIPTTSHADYFIKKIQELYMLRELIRRATTIVEKAYLFDGDMAVFSREVGEALQLANGMEKPKTLPMACGDTLAQLARVAKGEQTIQDIGYEWPWPDANKYFGPVQKAELVIIASRPSRGKSSVARQLAASWSEKYGSVLYFSREMLVDELPGLFAQVICGHSFKDARLGRLHAKDLAEMQLAVEEVKKWKNLIVNDSDRSLTQLCARVKAVAQACKLKAVFCDYLQIYDTEQVKGETRDMAIGRFTKAMKDIAMDLKIPVVLLAQIGRGSEREEREPRPSDLRESGNIEQDANRVVFIHWPSERRDGGPQDPNDRDLSTIHAKLIQAKGRSDGESFVELNFDRRITTFRSINQI